MAKFRDQIFAKPLNGLLLLSVIFLVISSSFMMIATMMGWNRSDLEVVLLVFGVLAILIVILRTENALAITMAVLIIGTVVAGERFLISVTALLGRTSEEGRKFVGDLYRNQGSQSRSSVDEEALARLIIERIQQSEKPAGTELVVADVIRQARVQQLADRVRDESASTPLLRLANDSWPDFLNAFRHNPSFRDDMNVLRDLELITFTGLNFENTTFTDLGRQVMDALNKSSFDRTVFAERLESDGPIETISDARFRKITPGTSFVDVVFLDKSDKWFKFAVARRGKFKITTEISDKNLPLDTTLTLYDSEKSIIAENDDNAEDLFSEIIMNLDEGDYFIRVSSLDGLAGEVWLFVVGEPAE